MIEMIVVFSCLVVVQFTAKLILRTNLHD